MHSELGEVGIDYILESEDIRVGYAGSESKGWTIRARSVSDISMDICLSPTFLHDRGETLYDLIVAFRKINRCAGGTIEDFRMDNRSELVMPGEIVSRCFHEAKVSGHSDKDMAAFAGVHVNTIQNWRAGRSKPGFAEIVTMAQMMGFKFTFEI